MISILHSFFSRYRTRNSMSVELRNNQQLPASNKHCDFFRNSYLVKHPTCKLSTV